MTGTAARHLYLARHGEASPDETALTDNGRRQAVLLGERLRSAPLSACYHGPLPRAEQRPGCSATSSTVFPAIRRNGPVTTFPTYRSETNCRRNQPTACFTAWTRSRRKNAKTARSWLGRPSPGSADPLRGRAAS